MTQHSDYAEIAESCLNTENTFQINTSQYMNITLNLISADFDNDVA